jgi:cysteine desulfurase/selenocysteine lyase
MDWNNIRQEFPALNKKVDEKTTIYFDNACNTLRPARVIEAMREYLEEHPGCAGKRSSHYFSKETEQKCREAREKLAKFIGAKTNEVVWTKNTTESINLVANSLEVKKGQNVVCSSLAHHSLLLPFHKKCAESNAELRVVECDNECKINAEKFAERIDKNTAIVAITHASNVAGTILPAKEIIKIAHENDALALVDGAQFVPHKALDVRKLDADFYCFSMHKMLGPSMGVLYGKEALLEDLNLFMVGGDTIRDVVYKDGQLFPEFLPAPKKFEAGLQNYAGIIGSGAAIEYLKRIGMEDIEERERRLCKRIIEKLSQIDEVEIVGPLDEKARVATVSLILKKKISAKDVAEYFDTELEKYRIMLRAGAHCANPLHYFLGLNPSKGEGTLRASLYFYNTIEEIDIFVNELNNLLKRVD